MHDYAMLDDGDHVLVGVSGGVDSLALVWLLHHWRKKAPIDYRITAVHIDKGFSGAPPTGVAVAAELARAGIDVHVERTTFGADAREHHPGNVCYHCARQRRNRLFALARRWGCRKVALGHHRDDLIETFFINLLYAGNLSTMRPRQDLFSGRLAIIRPFCYLDKVEVAHLARLAGMTPVKDTCPLADNTRRDEIREIAGSLYGRNPAFKASIFAALANPRPEYLLD